MKKRKYLDIFQGLTKHRAFNNEILFAPVFLTAGSISVPCRWLSSRPGKNITNKSSPMESEKGPTVLCLEIRNDLCLKSLPSLAENSLLHICKHGLKGCGLMFSKLGLRSDLSPAILPYFESQRTLISKGNLI